MVKQIPSALTGVFAALPTPYRPDGTPDVEKLQPILDFHLDKQVAGLCIGGATGEYAACSVEERLSLIRSVGRYLNGRASLITGIGGEHFGQVHRLARAAADAGAIAALLPAPFYFPYGSSDLLDFLRRVAGELPLPVLFYNIPQFTNELHLDDVLRLIESVPNVIGLKDSSGRSANLPLLLKAKSAMSMAFFIGSDDLLFEALGSGADGAISGVASACPDLIQAIYEAFRSGQKEKAKHLQVMLDDFIAHINGFPPPWGIKLALQARGIEIGSLNWPLGEPLRLKAEEFQAWFLEWDAKNETAWAKATSE